MSAIAKVAKAEVAVAAAKVAGSAVALIVAVKGLRLALRNTKSRKR